MDSPPPISQIVDVAVEDEAPQTVDSPSEPVVVDLRPKIRKQVEYYFSDENLPNDKFLLKHINKDKSGFVSVEVIASFRKMQKLTKDIALIIDALKESSLLVVSPNNKKVGRLHPLPLSEFKDPNPKLCTVVVENLPEDHSKEEIQRIFGQAGSIKSICICDPQSADFKQNIKAEKIISGKLHALVEYETVEGAEKAVLTLGDDKDWRNGLRVQLLQKRMAYNNNLGGKAWRGPDAGKGSHTLPEHAANEDNTNTRESQEETDTVQDGDNLPKEKDGRRGQNRRPRGHKQKGNTGMGHGNATTSTHIEAAKAPPPGPRMPDGTRGFTMGRGCPPVTTQF